MKYLIKPIFQASVFIAFLSVAIATYAKPNESDGPRYKKDGYSHSSGDRSKQYQNKQDHNKHKNKQHQNRKYHPNSHKRQSQKHHGQTKHKQGHNDHGHYSHDHYKHGNYKEGHHGSRWVDKRHKYVHVKPGFKHHNKHYSKPHKRSHSSARYMLDGYGDCYKQKWYNGYRVFKKVRQYRCYN